MKHGMTLTPEFKVWDTMLQRCSNPNNEKFPIYGARGIKVCERWKEFKNFIEDMGRRPSSKHSLGRINNNRNYSPENCRWETAKEQARNRRSNRLLTFQGRKMTMVEWGEFTGFGMRNIHNRINYLHWPIEKTLTTPVRIQ